MTRDDIIRMAKKAELQCYMNLTEHSLAIEELEHFAANWCADGVRARGSV